MIEESSVERSTPAEIEAKHWHLLFGVRRSIRYHDRRRGFFEAFHTLVVFLALLGGSATIAAFTSEFTKLWPEWAKLLPAVLVTVFSAAELVVGTVRKAWLHGEFVRRFVELEGRLITNPVTDDLVEEGWSRRLEIEAGEPTVLRVLDCICHNELLRAERYPKEEEWLIGFWQRRFAPFFDFREHTIRPQS